jgi:acyl-CoA reductase-like NAD-dependent aldehyde dehydrogenase
MAAVQRTITPIDDTLLVERPYASAADIARTVEAAARAQKAWKQTPIGERQKIVSRAVDAFVAKKDIIAEEITRQMGRPLGQSPGEIRGFEERSRYMIEIAPDALADIDPGRKDGFNRFIRREPLGTVFVVAPWNYPYLTSVNAIVPALMAGNAVILKHAAQTLIVGERFQQAYEKSGLPKGLFHNVVLSHEQTEKLIGSGKINHINFTGSVGGGKAVERAAAGTFASLGLELGGKDPAYVREDVKLDHAIENLVDGSFYNSGQCCCGIERIYVHEKVYEPFLEGFVDLTKKYVVGNPLEQATTLGPMARGSFADTVRDQIAEAMRKGAKSHIGMKVEGDRAGSPYLAPEVLTNVDHQMAVMREESFGPVVGIMKVRDDEEAITLMNDSPYGLTASIWTTDTDRAAEIGDRVATGTVFMNRCDYVDPGLVWTGVKDTGRGVTLSKLGYEHLTRPKSYHLRFKTG